MFKKMLASIGIGGAKVDTVLRSETVEPGGVLPVTVLVEAGSVEQDVSGLQLMLLARVKYETEDGTGYKNELLQSWSVEKQLTLQPGLRDEIDLDLPIHPETPITALSCRKNQSKVWLETGLEVDLAIDPSDKDPITIVPTQTMQQVMDAMQRCGLTMVKADIEQGSLRGDGFTSSLPCYQELEYRPDSWLTTLNEVEISFVQQGDITHLLIEVDRMMRGDSYLSLSIVAGTSDQEIESLLRAKLRL